MMTSLIELTNSMSDRWVSWVLASLLDTSALLFLVGVLWIAIRRHVSPQVGYCLFLLVPLKLLLPVSVTVPAAMAKWIPSVVVTSWFEWGPQVGKIESRHAIVTHDNLVMPHEPNLSEVDIVASPMRSQVVPTVSDESNLRINARVETKEEAITPIAAMGPQLSASAFAMIIWFLGVTFLLGRLFLTQLRFRMRLKQLEAVEESRLDLDLRELCRRVGATRNVRVIVSDDVSAPAVWGISRPTIILPRRVASSLSSQQLQWVLLHELAHIQRADLLVVACQRFAAVLHFFNPAIWIANRMIHRLREYACDDLAVLLSDGSTVDSGEAFLLILRQASQRQHNLNGALGVFGLDSRAACFSRVRRLMDTNRSIRIGIDRLSLCGLFLLAAIALPHIHAAQNANEAEPIAQSKDTTEPRAGANSDPPKPDKPNPKANLVLAKNVGEFELSVVGPDGKPIPEVMIELRTDPSPTANQIRDGKFVRNEDNKVFVTANTEGRLKVTFPKNATGFDVRIVTPGYGPYRANWSAEDDSQQVPAKFTAELESGMSVGGIVVDAEGNPIQGVTIRTRLPTLAFKNRPGDTSRREVGATMTTDDAGKWRFDSVPSSNLAFGVVIDHPDFMPRIWRSLAAEFKTQSDLDFAQRIKLDRGLTVTGKVTDETGNPIVGAEIRSRYTRIGEIRTVTTNDNGVYALSGCDPTMMRIVASAKGRAREMNDVSVKPQMEPVNFEMKAGGRIRVRVVDEMDKPISKAQVFFRHWRSDPFYYFEFDQVDRYADEAGVWEWNEAPLDEFQADICRPNGLCLPKRSLKARDEEYVFRLPAALVVVGKVVDAETKEPVKKFEVTTWNRSDTPGPRELGRIVGRVSSTDGEYLIQQIEGFEGRSIANRIQIESNGYRATELREIKFDAAGKATIDFELTKVKDVAAKEFATDVTPAGEASKSKKVPPTETSTAISLPPQCETALKHNVSALKTCSIKYSRQNEYAPLPDGARDRRPANGDDGYTVLDGGLFYHRRIMPNRRERARSDGVNKPNYEEHAFDGRIFYFGAPYMGRKGSITRYLGENTDDKEAQVFTLHVGYLEAAGFLVPRTIAEWKSSVFDSLVLKAEHEGKILKLTEDDSILTLDMEIPDHVVLIIRKMDLEKMMKEAETRGDAQFKENQLKLVELYRKVAARDPVRRVLFKLDREKGYAVKHQEDRTLDGKLIQTIDCEEFEFFPKSQIWLPRLCIERDFLRGKWFFHEFTEEPAVTSRIKLDEITFARPDDVSFKIDYGPGSRVEDLSIAIPQPPKDKQSEK